MVFQIINLFFNSFERVEKQGNINRTDTPFSFVDLGDEDELLESKAEILIKHIEDFLFNYSNDRIETPGVPKSTTVHVNRDSPVPFTRELLQ